MLQGSVLCPLLFVMYMVPISDIVLRRQSMSNHSYADDGQVYCSFKPASKEPSLSVLERCITEIRAWMTTNMMLLNDGKTDVILFGTKHTLAKQGELTLQIGAMEVPSISKLVKSLGVLEDQSLSMTSQVNATCMPCCIFPSSQH